MKIKKKPLIITCVSVVLCLAVALTSIFLLMDDGTPAKKKRKKKIIIIDDPIIAEETTDSDDNGYIPDNFDHYEVVDDDYEGDEEVVELPEFEVELDGNPISPMNNKIGMAMYGHNVGDWNSLLGDKYGDENEFITYYNATNIDGAIIAKKKGAMIFLTIGKPFRNWTDTTLPEAWKSSIISTAEAYKYAGVWDVVAGFHFDEPGLKMSGEQFLVLSKFLAETFPAKRIYPVVSTYEIYGNSPTLDVTPVSYRTHGYCTDIGLDTYGTTTYERMKGHFDQLLSQLGREDVRVWTFPCTYEFKLGVTDEQYMLDHLELCYKVLMDMKNPGGLHLYTWATHGGHNGLGRLLDESLNLGDYSRLAKRITDIGKEIKANPYTYNVTKN